MDIMELGAIGELVGGAAVLVTLVYLTVQASYTVVSSRLAASTAVIEGLNQAIGLSDNRSRMPSFSAQSRMASMVSTPGSDS